MTTTSVNHSHILFQFVRRFRILKLVPVFQYFGLITVLDFIPFDGWKRL